MGSSVHEQARQIRWLESEFAAILREKHVEEAAFHLPLAYREGHDYTHLGNRGGSYEQTDRSGPGHAGPAYSEDSCIRAAPRLGNRAAVKTGLRRGPAGQRRVALPCFAQAGARGVDYRGMEVQREQSSRQVLQPDAPRPQRIRKRGLQLGSPLRRHYARGETQGGLRYAFRTLVLHSAIAAALAL